VLVEAIFSWMVLWRLVLHMRVFFIRLVLFTRFFKHISNRYFVYFTKILNNHNKIATQKRERERKRERKGKQKQKRNFFKLKSNK
jgi:hypothetical protein